MKKLQRFLTKRKAKSREARSIAAVRDGTASEPSGTPTRSVLVDFTSFNSAEICQHSTLSFSSSSTNGTDAQGYPSARPMVDPPHSGTSSTTPQHSGTCAQQTNIVHSGTSDTAPHNSLCTTELPQARQSPGPRAAGPRAKQFQVATSRGHLLASAGDSVSITTDVRPMGDAMCVSQSGGTNNQDAIGQQLQCLTRVAEGDSPGCVGISRVISPPPAPRTMGIDGHMGASMNLTEETKGHYGSPSLTSYTDTPASSQPTTSTSTATSSPPPAVGEIPPSPAATPSGPQTHHPLPHGPTFPPKHTRGPHPAERHRIETNSPGSFLDLPGPGHPALDPLRPPPGGHFHQHPPPHFPLGSGDTPRDWSLLSHGRDSPMSVSSEDVTRPAVPSLAPGGNMDPDELSRSSGTLSDRNEETKHQYWDVGGVAEGQKLGGREVSEGEGSAASGHGDGDEEYEEYDDEDDDGISSPSGDCHVGPSLGGCETAASWLHGKPMKVKVHKAKGYQDLTNLMFIQAVHEHQGVIWSMKFSDSGKYLATGGQDGQVIVWSMEQTPQQRAGSYANSGSLPSAPVLLHSVPHRRYQGHTGDVLAVSWSHGFLLSASMDQSVRLWHVSMDRCLRVFRHPDFVTSVQFHPQDENYFFTGCLDGKIRLWCISEFRLVDWTDTHNSVSAMCVSRDGTRVAVGTVRGSCKFYNVHGTEKLEYETQIDVKSKGRRKSNNRKISGLQFVGSSSSLLLVTSNDSSVRLYDGYILRRRYTGLLNSRTQIHASLSHDGRFVVCGSDNGKIHVWCTRGVPSKKTDMPKIGALTPEQDLNESCESFKVGNGVVTCAIFAPPEARKLLPIPSIFSDHSGTPPPRSGAALSKSKSPKIESPKMAFCRAAIDAAHGLGAVLLVSTQDGKIHVFQNVGMPCLKLK